MSSEQKPRTCATCGVSIATRPSHHRFCQPCFDGTSAHDPVDDGVEWTDDEIEFANAYGHDDGDK